MAHLTQSVFTKYNLSEEEQLAGQQLTISNVQVIQNLICSLAEERIGLKLDPNNVLPFMQREAELIGQIGILQMLLDQSSGVMVISDSIPHHSV